MANNHQVLVTGGAGFIGSHLVERLLAKGYRVRILDNLFRTNKAILQSLTSMERVEFIEGDVRDEEKVHKAMAGVDYVFHEAAVCINRSVRFPRESTDINLIGSQVVFEKAIQHSVKKLIFASSASVYGEPKALPMKEESELNPITPYCIAKVASEQLLQFYARQGLNSITLRYFNVYGLRQSVDAYYTSVVIKFIKRILSGQAPIIDGKGDQSMDFVNVEDIVSANILAMESSVVNQVFNVGCGKSVSVAELAQLIIRTLGANIKPEFTDRKTIVSRRCADITKIHSGLGFNPQIPFETGMAELIRDIRANPAFYELEECASQ